MRRCIRQQAWVRTVAGLVFSWSIMSLVLELGVETLDSQGLSLVLCDHALGALSHYCLTLTNFFPERNSSRQLPLGLRTDEKMGETH